MSVAGWSRAPFARPAALLRLAALLAALLALWITPEPGRAGEPPAIVFSPEVVARTRTRVLAGDPTPMPALRTLIQDADAAMAAPAQAVVLKPAPPPGGDLHDYWSLAPDAAQESDPCADTYDRLRLRRMTRDSLTLAQAWHLTGKADYAGKGTALLWAWCCDSLTRARPDMTYAHARPGSGYGSHTGIIESRDLIDAAEAACLLADSPAWSAAVDRAVRGWFGGFLHWLRSSESGRLAAADQGCLGLWRDAQVAAFALYTGDSALARTTVADSLARMTAMTAQGNPAPGASALRAAITLAAVAERAGLPVWDQAPLRRILDTARPGPLPDCTRACAPDCADRLAPTDLAPFLLRAASACREPRYRELAGNISPDSRALLFH